MWEPSARQLAPSCRAFSCSLTHPASVILLAPLPRNTYPKVSSRLLAIAQYPRDGSPNVPDPGMELGPELGTWPVEPDPGLEESLPAPLFLSMP